jgi:phage baseplate assembly protein W
MATSIYQDLDLNFTQHPVRHDLVPLTDMEAIVASVRNLTSTNHYERPFHPEIGSNIRRLLFEPLSPFTASDIARFLRETITNFEPRVTIRNILSVPDDDRNGYMITLEFYVDVSAKLLSIQFLLERIR